MSLLLTRGAVVTVRFDPSEGREIRRTRPAVVVANNAACRFDAVVQVVPVTGLPKRSLRPYESRVASPESGLERPSRVVANQVRTISKQRIGEVIGQVTAEEEQKIDAALRIQLALAE